MRRVLTVLGLAVGAVVVVATAVAAVTVLRIDGSIERSEVEGLGEIPEGDAEIVSPETPEFESEAEGAHTILVLGSDTREVLTDEERRELHTGDVWGERTESIALVRLDPDADEIRMLNVPRDTLLTRCDGSRGRVNAAYGIGEREGMGALTCVVQTLTNWVDVQIDHVVKIDFRGFVDIVDTLGGVPMEIDEPLRDRNANLDLEPGCHRLDGVEALAFVRARSIDDEYGRQARQQRLVEEMRRELGQDGLFDEPMRLVRTVEAAAGHLETDSGLTLGRITDLAIHHRDTLRNPIEGRSIPGTLDDSSGTAFLRIEQLDAQREVDWLVSGDTSDGTSPDGTGEESYVTEEDAGMEGPGGTEEPSEGDEPSQDGEPTENGAGTDGADEGATGTHDPDAPVGSTVTGGC